MKNQSPLDLTMLEQYATCSVQWLVSSIEATGNRGSAGYYHIFSGWSEAYPETTGYLIDTLFNAARQMNMPPLKTLAIQSADWLCGIQLPNGAFPGGIGGNLPPIIFDTGMIVFGLNRTWRETKQGKYLKALERAVSWLENEMDEDGAWRSHAFVPGYLPTYYTMVTWTMLEANKGLKKKGLQQKLETSFRFFLDKSTPKLTFRDWGFRPSEPAFTHTIAYTLQGFLEAGMLLKNQEAISKVESVAGKILALRHEKGKLAGSYDDTWRGDFRFGCLVGQAQLGLLFFRLYEVTNKPEFLREAQLLLWQLLRFQSPVKINGWLGGMPGSAPIWGKYQPWRFPNWATKYFLDACLACRSIKI